MGPLRLLGQGLVGVVVGVAVWAALFYALTFASMTATDVPFDWVEPTLTYGVTAVGVICAAVVTGGRRGLAVGIGVAALSVALIVVANRVFAVGPATNGQPVSGGMGVVNAAATVFVVGCFAAGAIGRRAAAR